VATLKFWFMLKDELQVMAGLPLSVARDQVVTNDAIQYETARLRTD
jgi:hypothetical protein